MQLRMQPGGLSPCSGKTAQLAYNGILFYHEACTTELVNLSVKTAHTNGIESFCAMLKHGYQGTFTR